MKKFFITLGITIVAILCITHFTNAQSASYFGFLWGGTTDNDVFPPNCSTGEPGLTYCGGIGWININSTQTGSPVPYGISIPIDGPAAIDGPITGLAWASTGIIPNSTPPTPSGIGWIDFAPAGPYPRFCPNPCSQPLGWPNWAARREDNNLTGWARIVSIQTAQAAGNSGGWAGWIKLAGNGYGVTILPTGYLSGYAWSNELGFIDFSRVNSTIPTPTCTLTANPNANPRTGTISWTTQNASSCNPTSNPSDGSWNGARAAINASLPSGSTAYGPIGSNTDFNLLCTNNSGGTGSCSTRVDIVSELTVGCSGTSDTSNPLVINWTGIVFSGGTPPFTYDWDFTANADAAPQNPSPSLSSTQSTRYTIAGQKTAHLEVRDSGGITGRNDCTAVAGKKGILHEILPFF